MNKDWIFRTRRDGAPMPASFAAMAGRCGVSPRLARLLWLRGLDRPEAMAEYLSPGLRYLARPALWPGMEQAADVLARGLREGRKMAIWGDYDADGVTSTALALEVLHHHGFDALRHLPDRRSEGYGMNAGGVEELARQGVSLLLTVDCGISDVAAIARARELGMDVVVTDHHLPPELLPPATVLCNPKLGDCPCATLAGVGVTFFLMAELNSRLAEGGRPRMDMRRTLDLVALGTLADLVELEGQNRILVKNGLLVLAEAKRPGISELKAVSGFAPLAALGAGQVIFSLAPRINAAGRVASAETALALLCAEDCDSAAGFARALDAYNTQRRQEEERITEQAMVQAEGALHDPALVIAGRDWNQGVIGIVASRLVEKYHKPTLVLCTDGDTLKGSGRSISGFNLHAGLMRCSEDLLACGGHRMAAGLRLKPEKLEAFRTRFLDVVREELGPDPVPAVQMIDDELSFREAADFVFLKELEMMQPFGVGNPEPVFQSPPLLVKRRRLFGQQKNHVLLELTDESCNITLQAKAWRQAGEFPADLEGRRVVLAYSPAIDMYNGAASVDVRIRDWKMA
ncbi:single-stranded-DNA-specific exonuclease RecJ [uncultured Mailhella sp.]|uniref:single-stranded-DNA-specific exonuclease RecJ n=1 Tax=uncultured Mailhella sp. TaxID=1981031 RepID=UPI0025FC0D32|nr:single-stranded-DNA-specific exonuclease RecJ [uncultured Mailhella sp.]